MSRFIAIDILNSGIYLVSGHANGKAVTLEASAADRNVGELTESNVGQVGESLRNLIESAGIGNAPVLMSIPRDKVIWKSVKHPKAPALQEPSVVRFQAMKEMTQASDGLVMDYIPSSQKDPNSPIQQAMVMFVNKSYLDKIQAVCNAAGLKLSAVMPRPYASMFALYRASETAGVVPFESTATIGILSLWNRGGELTVFRNHEVIFSRSVPAASLASESAMIGDLKRSIASYDVQFPSHPLKTIYLSEAESGGWLARLQTSFSDLTIHGYEPTMESTSNSPSNLRGMLQAPVGLLASRNVRNASSPNFLQPRKPKAEVSKTRVMVMLGLLLFIALFAGGWVIGLLETRKLKREIEGLNAQKEMIRSQMKPLEMDSKRLAAVDQFNSRDLSWLDIFYDLNEMFPRLDRMRLKEFDGEIYFPPPAKTPVATAPKGPTPGTVAGSPQPVTFSPGPTPRENGNETKAILKITLITDEIAYADNLKDKFNAEKIGYTNAHVTVGASVGSGNSKYKEFTITANVLKRKPVDFKRFIPPPPPPPKEESATTTADENPATPADEITKPADNQVKDSKDAKGTKETSDDKKTEPGKKSTGPLVDPNPPQFPDDIPNNGGQE